LGTNGKLGQEVTPEAEAFALLTLLNSLTLNFYVRSKVSTGVSVHHLYELPTPESNMAARKQLVAAAGELLKNPRDVKERAALEVFIARELYGLSLDDWKHLTGTFTFGSGDTKAELDETIRLSHTLWT
jgi:heptaprenylglyceryl phosphate synthase